MPKYYLIKCAPFGLVKELHSFSITFDALGRLQFGEVAAKTACEMLNNTYFANTPPLFEVVPVEAL